MSGFKKYSVNHEALFNDVRSNRYSTGATTEPAKNIKPPVERQSADAAPDALAAPAATKDQAIAPHADDNAAPQSSAAAEPATQPVPNATSPKASDTVQVRVRVRFPAPGVSAKYDALAAQLGEEDAFRAIFRAAFENYRNRLDEGKMPDGPKSYTPGKETHRSTKVMTARQFKVVTDALDPDGLTAPSTLGRIISERALALFFEKER